MDCSSVMSHCQSYSDEQIIDLVLHETDTLVESINRSQKSIVVVTSEVGAGLSPPKAIARLFRMLVSRCNANLASNCQNVLLLTAGIPHLIKVDPRIQSVGAESSTGVSNKSSAG